MVIAAVVLLGSAAGLLWASTTARSQHSGTMLDGTLTFAGTDAATIEITVAGPRSANTATRLSLEFGPDGTGVPAAGALIPDTASFTLSNGSTTKVFHPVGNDASQPFPDKQVDFSRPDATRPNLLALSVVHRTGIPDAMAEVWKLVIAGLPQTNWRAIGTVQQGSFTRLAPSGFSDGTHPIDIAPAQVKTGGTATLTVTSVSGFDLSAVTPAQVSIGPGDDIGDISVTEASARSLTLSVDLLNRAEPGPRTLSIRMNDTTVHGRFAVAQGPAIRVSRIGNDALRTFTITGLGGVDFSAVATEDVRIQWWLEISSGVLVEPILIIKTAFPTIVSRTANSMTMTLADSPVLPTGRATLYVNANGRTLQANIALGESNPPHICQTSDHCCDDPERPGTCELCLPRDQVCGGFDTPRAM